MQNNISLGYSKQQVIESLGTPKKESVFREYETLWYDSIAPFKADIYFFENGNLILNSSSIKEETPLQNYLDIYGNPELSLNYYPPEFQLSDTENTTIHIWPQQGIDIVSFGSNINSPAVLKRVYNSTFLEEYLNGLGQDFSKNNRVEINKQTPSIELKKLESKQYIGEIPPSYGAKIVAQTLLLSVFLILVIVIAITTFIFWFKKRKNNNKTATKQQQIPTL